MSWTVPLPQDNWKERDTYVFLREVWTRIKADTFTWDPPNLASGVTTDTTLTSTDASQLAGLRAGMPIFVTPPSTLNSGLVVAGAWVPSDDQLTIRIYNSNGSATNPLSGTWGFGGFLP